MTGPSGSSRATGAVACSSADRWQGPRTSRSLRRCGKLKEADIWMLWFEWSSRVGVPCSHCRQLSTRPCFVRSGTGGFWVSRQRGLQWVGRRASGGRSEWLWSPECYVEWEWSINIQQESNCSPKEQKITLSLEKVKEKTLFFKHFTDWTPVFFLLFTWRNYSTLTEFEILFVYKIAL